MNRAFESLITALLTEPRGAKLSASWPRSEVAAELARRGYDLERTATGHYAAVPGARP